MKDTNTKKELAQKTGAAPEKSCWALGSYPDYVAEVNQSIRFFGVEHDHFTRGKAESLLLHLERLKPGIQGIRVLDIGCGQGLIHPYLCKTRRLGLTGIDVAADALQIAREANPDVEYRHYDGARLPFPDASFDAAFTICVMHHVEPQRWSSFVADAKRILRPGGFFMVFEHNPWNPLTRFAVSRCRFDHDAVLLSAPRVRQFMHASGFVDIKVDFIFFTPFSSLPIKRLERFARWIPLGAQYVCVGCKPGKAGKDLQ